MKALAARQVQAVEWNFKEACCFVAASGYESRAPNAAKRLLPEGPQPGKQLFGFAERKVGARAANDQIFAELGFAATEELPMDSAGRMSTFVQEYVTSAQSDHVTIVVDYSCMTKIWYAEIIQALTELEAEGRTVDVYFAYSPARFTPPGPPGVNSVAGAIRGFCHLVAPANPTALILGLGYEAVRAMGLRDYLDPEVTLAFYTEPALEPEFSRAVKWNNRALLETLPANTVFAHPMGDLDYTGAVLRNVAVGLADTHRVVVAPLGPKPFCLISLLLAADCKCLDVWRVSGVEKNIPQERSATGDVLLYKVTFGDAATTTGSLDVIVASASSQPLERLPS